MPDSKSTDAELGGGRGRASYGEETVKSTIGEAFRCGKTQRDNPTKSELVFARKNGQKFRAKSPNAIVYARARAFFEIFFSRAKST